MNIIICDSAVVVSSDMDHGLRFQTYKAQGSMLTRDMLVQCKYIRLGSRSNNNKTRSFDEIAYLLYHQSVPPAKAVCKDVREGMLG